MAFAQPLTKETANPNAATAAASAFMRRDSASNSLSSAAAAAALKARPTTPTNVSEVQSKRSTRRSESVSSMGGRGRRQGRATELYRSPSTGSMTERTFRSPSPSPGRAPAPRKTDVPPVPSLPRDTRRPTSSHNGTGMTMNVQTFRTASQKQKDGQGSWFGGASGGNLSNVRKSDLSLQQYQHHPQEDPDARPGSVSPSINFSYPRGKMESPTPDSEPQMVYDANSRRMVPKVDLMMRSQSVRSAADAPVKKRDSKISRIGSHLSKGSLSRIKGTAVGTSLPASRDSTPPPRQQTPVLQAKESSPAPQPEKPTGPQLSREQTLVESESGYEEDNRSQSMSTGALDSTIEEPVAPVLKKQPSIVREEPELENDSEELKREHDRSATEAALTRASSAGTDPVDHQSTSRERENTTFTAPAGTLEAPTTEPGQKSGSARKARVHSESPARSAHFAPTTDQLLVRHEPPPRSLSPRKSALKNSSSARGASPSDDSSEASGPVSSLSPKDEQARKKSVRVSFNDDSNVVVGEAAEPIETDSPMVPSPQAKKTWHNVFKRSKKDTDSVDEDETMSPRPALPLFGSVRQQKPKDQVDSERPLVRPSERAWSPPTVSSPLRQSAAAEAEGPASDTVIGSVLSSETSSKNEANISRTREPLPPVVTSAEGMAYDSSSFMSTDDETEKPAASEDVEVAEKDPSVSTGLDQKEVQNAEESKLATSEIPDKSGMPDAVETTSKPKEKTNGSASSGNIPPISAADEAAQLPSIAITNPSPAAKEESKTSPSAEYFDIPGGFPADFEDDKSSSSRPTPASLPVVQQPVTSAPAIDTEPVPPSPTRSNLPMGDIIEEEEGTDNSSIYSDAYEDMSDADGGGFMSLDAVLTAPADSKVSKLYQKTKRKSQEHTREPASDTVAEDVQKKADSQPTQNDWENAKSYWKSLSVNQRRQLDLEALEEAGEEADGEGDGKVKKNKKKRRSTDRPISTSSTSSQAHHPDRIYQIQPGTSWTSEEEKPVARSKSTPPPTAPVAAPKFKKSMRGASPPKVEAAPAPTGMRKSMRSNGGPAKPEKPAGPSRPVSYHPSTATESSRDSRRALSQDSRPMSSSGATGGMRTTMRRRGSDSSESSFRRARPASQGFGFRNSMRASAEPESPQQGATKGSGRFSLRSLSPTGSTTFRRGSFTSPPPQQTAMGGPSRMRTSMRSQQPKQKQKTGFFGGKKEKKGKGGSRFAESSDEEDGGGRFFSSRFAESSDEEESAPPPRAGGMASKSMRPNRPNKGANSAAAAALGRPPVRSDSPDLPDSDDDLVQPKRNNTVTNGIGGRPTGHLQRNRSGRGSLTGPASPGAIGTEGVGERPSQQRRGSFMSGILRRKKDNSGKITRDTSESAARRDTHLQRSQEELNVIRSNSGRVLHKRETSWPLPDTQPTNRGTSVPPRPATSSGPSPAAKAGFLKRRSISHQGMVSGMPQQMQAQPDSPATTGSMPDGIAKKKKFGTLRKMFGLNN